MHAWNAQWTHAFSKASNCSYFWLQPCTMALQAAEKVLQQPMVARLPVSPLAGVSLFRSHTQNRSNCLCQLLCHLSSCLCVQPAFCLALFWPQKASIIVLWQSSAKTCSSPEHLLCHRCGAASPGSCPRSAQIASPGIRPLPPSRGLLLIALRSAASCPEVPRLPTAVWASL